ncbi:MAG: type I pullulanase, partial [Oscillospiraceae bacterium]|nr:type I pullulanase [Oscillospiraceae bacterium]
LSMDENSGIKNKGKFLGIVEEGTKTPIGTSTGLDHIKDLGVTHIHFLPSFDYGSVDESKPEEPQFNWGYDPMNFNVPEGSYSTDPKNGAVRIKEMKKMVQKLHKNGIGIVMDVVYNHVYLADKFCFNVLVPGYFSRIDENGIYSEGSGCGNDTASERSMVKKYIVDSVKYWADEYHIDGFRFDLSGLLDIATMNEITEAVHPEHPNVIFYCEGWDMPTKVTKPVVELANKNNSEKMPGCSFFSDTVRDMLIGSAFDAKEKGFISGKKTSAEIFGKCFRGMPDWCKDPSKSINYVSCHDGYTLFDRLSVVLPDSDFCEKVRRNNLAAAVYMLSQGVPLFQAGEEMLRSKVNPDGSFEHNSYNSPDSVNSIKWGNLDKPEYKKVFEYYKGLIRFRKAHGALRMKTAEDVYSHITDVKTGEENVFAYHIWGNVNGETSEAIFVAFNAETEEKEIALPVGNWGVRIFDKTAGDEDLFFAEGKIKIPPLSAAVMVK